MRHAVALLALTLAACAHPVTPPKPLPEAQPISVLLDAAGDTLTDVAADFAGKNARACIGITYAGAIAHAVADGITGVTDEAHKLPDLDVDPSACGAVDTNVDIPSEVFTVLRSSRAMTEAALAAAFVGGRLSCLQYRYGVAGTQYAVDAVLTGMSAAQTPDGPVHLDGPTVDFAACQ